MGTTLGTRVGTMLGTELADMVDPGPLGPFDATKLYAFQCPTGESVYETQVGGGEPGDGTEPWGVLEMIYESAVGAEQEALISAWDGTSGWYSRSGATGGAKGTFYRPDGGFSVVYGGAIMRPGGISVRGFDVGGGVDFAVYAERAKGWPTNGAGFAPAPVATTWGARGDGTRPAVSGWPMSWLSWRGALTDEQWSALFAQVRELGDVPTTIAGVTVVKRYSLKETLAARGVGVPDGSPAPATVPETVSGAAIDTMTASATPPVVHIIDPTTPRRWNYETTPILYGAEGNDSLADYFESLVNALPGSSSGFTVSVLASVSRRASGTRTLFSQRSNTNPGWSLSSFSGNGYAAFRLGGASGAIQITSSAIYPGGLGLYTGVWDATAGVGRLFAARGQSGVGTVLSGGFAPNTSVKPMIGRSSDGAANDGVVIYGASYSLGAATLAQYQAHWDACVAAERMVACPGLPGVVIDLTTDVLENGGTLPATLTDRGTGGVNFTRVGAPALSPHYARVWTA